MTTWLSDFSRTFLDAVRDLLWRQWSSLGVPGATAETHEWIVDPEALLVGTIQFGRYDPRLFDAALDWCLAHGKWMSTTRLRWLRKDLANEEARILAATASALASRDRSAKWRGLRGAGEDEEVILPARQGMRGKRPRVPGEVRGTPDFGPPIPLFLTREDRPAPHGTATDPDFLRHGVARPPWEGGRVASRLNLRKPAALRLRMRALFGIGSRAEIVLFLVTHRGGHPRRVARQINYAQPPVAKAMADMAQAGFLAERRTAREVEYSLAMAAWRRFLDVPDGLGWAQWGLVFRGLRRIWGCLQEMRGRPLTTAVLGSQLSTCAEQVNALLHESELGVVFETMVPGRPEDSAAMFEEGARELFRRVGTAATTGH